ncbi:hypothetical protein CRUP_033063 [Coryphaenoides rupestris]|nr:hypothetical protein CRUP_033063 [Coryphaenoides rupestris]
MGGSMQAVTTPYLPYGFWTNHGCWEQLCSAWPMSVSAATFLLLNEFISSSSSRRFSSRFLFSSGGGHRSLAPLEEEEEEEQEEEEAATHCMYWELWGRVMALTQDRVLTFLLERGGHVRNSELLSHFNRHINNCGDDPAGKQRNRDAFKRSVNSVAVVKHVDGVKCVVAKKRYRDFVAKGDADGQHHHHGLHRESSSRPDPSCRTPISPASPTRGSDQAESAGEMLGNEAKWAQSTTITRKVDESVPLEPIAHEWLVKSGAGMWRHVHGLLLLDPQLVTRRDFMSGFTALHWAAKGGNGEMVRKIMDISKSQGTTTTAATGVVDVNSKTHGGYTPLHLAAIHGHKDVMTLLVQGYGARVNVRDNAGKKPYHYLLAGGAGTGSAELEELLGGGQQQRDHPSRVQAEGEEEEHQQPRELLLPKGLNTLSKLFQPTMGHHKKHRP